MDMFIGTLAGVWELFGHIQVLRNFDSLSSSLKWILQRRSVKDNCELERIVSFSFLLLVLYFLCLYLEMLKWLLKVSLLPYNYSRSGSSSLCTSSHSFISLVRSHKVLKALFLSLSPWLSKDSICTFPPAGPQHGRLGTRDGRAEGSLRENFKVSPVLNVSWDD